MATTNATIENDVFRVGIELTDGKLTVSINERTKTDGITVIDMYNDGNDIIRIGTDNSVRLIV